jgi:peptidoglycan endopeptidase LytF
MDNPRGRSTSEAIEPENLEIELTDSMEYGNYGHCPNCSIPRGDGPYYSNLFYRYDLYGIRPTSIYDWYYGHHPWGWLADWPGIIGQIPAPPAVCSGFYYTVRPKETLWDLSRRFGVSLTAFMAANPQITDPNIIYAGQIICVPFPPAPRSCQGFLYTIRSGESLFTIARHFGVSMTALLRANPQIVNPNIIYTGQVICIPYPRPPAVCRGFLYTVMDGDTIARIGRRFGVRPGDILRANPQIVNPDIIFPGQTICIPFPPPPDCRDGFLYTIQRGDSLFSIARKYNITLDNLLAANPQIVSPDIIFVGQVICIPQLTAVEEFEAAEIE